MRYIYAINLECCKCARIRLHCANDLAVCSCSRQRRHCLQWSWSCNTKLRLHAKQRWYELLSASKIFAVNQILIHFKPTFCNSTSFVEVTLHQLFTINKNVFNLVAIFSRLFIFFFAPKSINNLLHQMISELCTGAIF